MLAGLLAGMLASPGRPGRTNSSLCPGLWKTTYEVEGASPEPREPRVVWPLCRRASGPLGLIRATARISSRHDLLEEAQLQRNSTSLKWKTQCRGPGPDAVADVIEASGANRV